MTRSDSYCGQLGLLQCAGAPGIPVHAYQCTCVAGFANGVCEDDFIEEYATGCEIDVGGNCDVDVDECVSSPFYYAPPWPPSKA